MGKCYKNRDGTDGVEGKRSGALTNSEEPNMEKPGKGNKR